MSYEVVYVIHCDKCSRGRFRCRMSSDTSISLARSEAVTLGWIFAGNTDQDICPTCCEEFEQKKTLLMINTVGFHKPPVE